MKYIFIAALPFIASFFSCSPRGKFFQSSGYESTQQVEKLYLAVIGSDETNECFDYLEDYLKDSLTSHGVTVESKYYCCRGKNTDVTQVGNDMIPAGPTASHI